MKMPTFSDSLQNIRTNMDYAEARDLGNLLNSIQNDSRLGFSSVSFVRQAISARESFMKESCCVRGRLCGIPGHWGRDLLRHPPSEAELPEDFEQSFLIGKPVFFSQHVFRTIVKPIRSNSHVFDCTFPYGGWVFVAFSSELHKSAHRVALVGLRFPHFFS